MRALFSALAALSSESSFLVVSASLVVSLSPPASDSSSAREGTAVRPSSALSASSLDAEPRNSLLKSPVNVFSDNKSW